MRRSGPTIVSLLSFAILIFVICIFANSRSYERFSEDRTVRPYAETSPAVREAVLKSFQKQWGDDAGIEYDDDLVRRLWKYPDMLFVMTDANDAFVGTIGIDRSTHLFFPFVSHLYVSEPFRNEGVGTRLLEIAEKHAPSLRANTIYLWCEDDGVGYYEKRGWSLTKSSWMVRPIVGNTLMKKEIS